MLRDKVSCVALATLASCWTRSRLSSVHCGWSLLVCLFFLFFFFFFQAEDGIRDLTVTGVQTCALPIARPGASRSEISQAIVRCVPAHGLVAGARLSRLAPLRFRPAKTIPRATDRLDPAADRPELATQSLEVHVDRAGAHVRLGAPPLLQQLGTALHSAFALDQGAQQLELGRGQLALRAIHRDAVRRAVQEDRPGAQPASRRDGGFAQATQDRPDPQDEVPG